MASSYNINLPDGSSLPVPAWATEQTLQQVAQMLNKNNLSVDIITDLMQENNMDVSNYLIFSCFFAYYINFFISLLKHGYEYLKLD